MWPSDEPETPVPFWADAEEDAQEGPSSGTAEAQALVHLLGSGGAYVRTGLLLLPKSWLGREGEIAVRLGASHVNYQQWKLSKFSTAQSFLLLSAERLIDELDELCLENHARATLLVSLLDLPLTALRPDERSKFWHFMHGAFSKRPRSLLLALPEMASAALPSDPEQWQASGRLAHWQL